MEPRFNIWFSSVGALLMSAVSCFADDEPRFQYELTLETGVEQTFDPETTSSEIFFNTEIGVAYHFSSQLVGFAELSLESKVSAKGEARSKSRSIEMAQLGMSYGFGSSVVSVGVIDPYFGSINETARGYFASDFIEDYDIEKAYGLIWAFDLGEGVATASSSIGGRVDQEDRRRSGRPKSVALQYDFHRGANTYHLGARAVSYGDGSQNTERGLAFGMSVNPDPNLELVAEIAAFDNWQGSSERSIFASLGGSFERGQITYSGVYTNRQSTGGEVDHLLALGLEWVIDDGLILSSGYKYQIVEAQAVQSLAISVAFTTGN